MMLHVVGARPNYVKAAPVIRSLEKRNVKQLIVNTSQHYSDNMSKDIMSSVGMKEPDIVLPTVTGDSIYRLSFMIEKLYEVMVEHNPSTVIVYGDVDSTLAAAISTKKYGARLVHVESGLRSFDETMPEEINRRIVDEISDICFVTEDSGMENLKHKDNVFFVGNTMIDSIVWVQNNNKLDSTEEDPYILLTCHRPSNVDDKDSLEKILDMCSRIKIKTIWPIHPRTKNQLKKYGMYDKFSEIENLAMVEPMSYVDFLKSINNSVAVVTDSGGIQEETTFLGILCFTIRENTERPCTISIGTNKLVDFHDVPDKINNLPERWWPVSHPPLWDGKASERISEELLK